MSSQNLRSEHEAAEFLGVTAGTLSVWRSTGRYPLKFVKVGRLVKYEQKALDEFVALRTREHTGTAD